MADISIHFDLRVGRRSTRWLMAAVMVLAAAPEVASESVTLSTYYPAPSGVYTNMITTGQTLLARDGGNVGIGSNTAPGYKLDVTGTFRVTSTSLFQGVATFNSDQVVNGLATFNGASVFNGAATFNQNVTFNGNMQINGSLSARAYLPAYSNWNSYGTGSGGAAVYNDAGGYQTLMIVGNSSHGSSRQVGVWDRLVVHGDLHSDGTVIAAANTCYFVSFTAGQQTLCPAGKYVTFISGVMNKYTVINNGVDPTGDALCCTCPSGLAGVNYSNGCPNF
jgi:hypothetical protein